MWISVEEIEKKLIENIKLNEQLRMTDRGIQIRNKIVVKINELMELGKLDREGIMDTARRLNEGKVVF